MSPSSQAREKKRAPQAGAVFLGLPGPRFTGVSVDVEAANADQPQSEREMRARTTSGSRLARTTRATFLGRRVGSCCEMGQGWGEEEERED